MNLSLKDSVGRLHCHLLLRPWHHHDPLPLHSQVSYMLNQPNAVIDNKQTKTTWIFHTFQACQAWWCKILRNENLNNSGFNNLLSLNISSNILYLGSTVAFGEFSLQPALLLGWVFPKQKILAFLHFVSEIFFFHTGCDCLSTPWIIHWK